MYSLLQSAQHKPSPPGWCVATSLTSLTPQKSQKSPGAKLLVAGLLVVLLAACGGNSDPVVNTAGAAAGGNTAAGTTPVVTTPAVTPPVAAAPVVPPAVTVPVVGVTATTTTTTPTVTASITVPSLPTGPTTTTTITPVGANGLPAAYRGTITFDTELANGTADVLWTRYEELPDTSSYVPTGTARVTLTPPMCDPVSIVVPIFATPPNGFGPFLVVRNTNAAPAFQKAYNFTLDVEKVSVTFSCKESANSTKRVSVVSLATSFVTAGACVALSVEEAIAGFARYTEPNQLKGSQACLLLGQRSASWDFRAQ